MTWGAEQSTIEKIRKEWTVKGETQEYATKDKTIEKMGEMKCNHLSVPVMHHLQTILLIEKAYKNILWSYSEDQSHGKQINRIQW